MNFHIAAYEDLRRVTYKAFKLSSSVWVWILLLFFSFSDKDIKEREKKKWWRLWLLQLLLHLGIFWWDGIVQLLQVCIFSSNNYVVLVFFQLCVCFENLNVMYDHNLCIHLFSHIVFYDLGTWNSNDNYPNSQIIRIGIAKRMCC